jgi:hypothetical protein
VSNCVSGKIVSLVNFEILERLFSLTILKQNFEILIAPFMDGGSILDDPEKNIFESMRFPSARVWASFGIKPRYFELTWFFHKMETLFT